MLKIDDLIICINFLEEYCKVGKNNALGAWLPGLKFVFHLLCDLGTFSGQTMYEDTKLASTDLRRLKSYQAQKGNENTILSRLNKLIYVKCFKLC